MATTFRGTKAHNYYRAVVETEGERAGADWKLKSKLDKGYKDHY